jgi:dihydrofolate synthase/folylpolyglutamate synthase
MNAKLVKVNDKVINTKKSDEYGHLFDYTNKGVEYKDIKLSLIGEHQLKNAATVLSAVMELKEIGYAIEENHIRDGLESVKWPCRLSIVSKTPLILIDGAHNDEGVDSLKAALEKYFGNRKIIFLFGMLKDKSYGYAVKQLMPLASSVVTTEPISPRALSAKELAESVREYCSDVTAEENIINAIEKAKANCENNSMICVCGSLYLAGSVYEYILSKKS